MIPYPLRSFALKSHHTNPHRRPVVLIDTAVLTAENRVAGFELGQTLAIYRIDEHNQSTTLMLVPASKRQMVCPKREFLDTHEVKMLPGAWNKMRAQQGDSLVQLQLRHLPGPNGFAQGLTMRNNPSTGELRFESQARTRLKTVA